MIKRMKKYTQDINELDKRFEELKSFVKYVEFFKKEYSS